MLSKRNPSKKHLRNLKGKQRHMRWAGVDLEGWAEDVLNINRRVFYAL
jgi:hypothetical protein